MVLLRALLRRRGAGRPHAALRLWPSRVPWASPLTPTTQSAAPEGGQPLGSAAAQRQFHAARPWLLAGDSQRPPGQPSPAMDTAAAAYLEQHGISGAQLQQEQPAAAAALTLPLAQLLVRAVVARQGLKNTLAPAELAARLVFLASTAGVSEAVLQQLYLNQPTYLQFKLDSAQEVLAWLRANLGDRAVQRVAAGNPGVWRSLRPTLEAAKADLQQVLSLSNAAWVEAVESEPMLLSTFSRSTAEEVVGCLRSDIGMSQGDISRLFKRQPLLFCMRAPRLSGLLSYLLDRLHFDRSKAADVVLNCSNLASLSQSALESRVADLEQYGFTASQIGRMVLGNPLLLSCTFQSVIFPALSQLEHLLTGHQPGMTAQERRAVVIEVVARGGSLIVSKPAKLQANFDFLLSRGLSLEEARAVLRRNPQVFKSELSSEGFADKLRYYESVLGVPVAEMLVEHSGYLNEGLAKVDQRVFCMERRGKLQLLRESKALAWVKLPADKFCDRFGVSLKEWEECAAEWASSKRAQQYRLVGQASKRHGGFAVDYRRAGAATKATYSRRRGGN